MRILVVGAAGGVGTHVVRELLAAGHEVRAADARATQLARLPEGLEKAAILRGSPEPSWEQLVEGCDAVVAIASRLTLRRASDREPRTWAPFSAGLDVRNLDGEDVCDLAERAVGPLADAAARQRVSRFLLISTAAVAGRPVTLPGLEGDWKRPVTRSARRAWEIERRAYLRHVDAGLPLTTLRPGLVYGPDVRGGIGSILPLLALAAARGRRPWVPRRGPVVHLVHVEDVARAALLVLAHPYPEEVAGRAFHVADETPLPLEELVRGALDAMGIRGTPVRVPWLQPLARLAGYLARALPEPMFSDLVLHRIASDWARAARRLRLSRALLPRLDDASLEQLTCDRYHDTSRLTGLGFVPRHPVAIEGLQDHVRWCVERRWLPPPRSLAALPAPREPLPGRARAGETAVPLRVPAKAEG